MSARREHRLRRLERRVDALEGAERERAERLARIQKVNETYWRERRLAMDTARMSARPQPQKGLLQRIMDFFSGR